MAAQSSFRRLLLLATVTFTVFIAVGGTQIMRRPSNYKSPARTFPLEKNPKINRVDKREVSGNHETIEPRATGKVSFAYFTNWGIYGANFQPTDIVDSTLTHILYSFADVNPSTGSIFLTDSYADQEKHFAGDSWSETGNNLYGNLKQLYLLKLKRRNLKVLLSIGGWTYSQAGHFNFVTSSSSRATFVTSAVQLVEDYGFDGVDLDFEFPANDAQGQGLADLFTALRTAFDQLAARKGDTVPYELSAAVSAGPANYQYLKVPQLNKALTYWNLMAYDYAGSWLSFADHQANLYGGARTGFNTDNAVKWYTANGATPSKITLGMPLYGRAFENTAGIGQPYSGIGPGTIEAGVYSYKALPIAGAQVFESSSEGASYSYDSAKKELVSYDTPNIVKQKTQYINSKGLGGSMFWELSTDKVGSTSLVGTSVALLGTLDQTQNHIKFPSSKWDNLRNNFGGGGSGTTSAPPTTTTTPSGSCSGIAAWTSTTVYVGGQQATYAGHLWTAKWWTQGETPGAADVWTDARAC
ncbi:Chitinase 1 [Hypsizygus marmoreus]|uniref:chitinase n=1 Tax=Hypsizygus marmoreus TaxID=39966 RepID=A0A369JWX5_HYPMA|nr:Chitinase 1 [Hypsizygus marmoreus]